MSKIGLFLAAFLIFSGLSCYDSESEDDCEQQPADCHEIPYTAGSLTVYYTLNSENTSVTIEIFSGDVDDGGLIESVTRSSGSSYTKNSMPLGHYSARIIYNYGAMQIEAIDADSIESESDEYCEGTCYELVNAEIDCAFDVKAFEDFRSGDDAKCFIATAAYGSALSPEVKVLRNFRDMYLMKSSAGRSFVELYYSFSPPAARIISENPFLRFLTRLLLAPLIHFIKYPVTVLLLPLIYILSKAVRLFFNRKIRIKG